MRILEKLTFVPFVGSLVSKYILSLFLRPFVIMLSKGIPASKILLSQSAAFAQWPELYLFFVTASQSISRGERLSEVLGTLRFFDLSTRELILLAGESSELEKTLEEIAAENEADLENTMKSVSSLIEPAVIIMIGVIVLFFVVTFIAPMMSIDINN